MAGIKAFTNFIIKRHGLLYVNPFNVIPKRFVDSNPISVKKHEFLGILKVISYENGFVDLINKTGGNLFRPWVKAAFLLGLFTGGRRDEVTHLKWSGIKLDDQGKLALLTVNHFKSNKAARNLVTETEFKIKKFAIHAELENLLYELGYEENKNSDKYILVEENMNRDTTMKAFMSRAFSHYIKQFNSESKKTFKHLRKSYATKARIEMGKNAGGVTQQNLRTMDDFYVDDEELLKEAGKRMRFLDDD